MWLSLVLLFAPHASADRFEYVTPKPYTVPEAVLFERYADLFDDGLRRRFQHSTLSGTSKMSGDAQGELLGSAAAQAATDWSVWILRRVPAPAISLPVPTRRRSTRSATPTDGLPKSGHGKGSAAADDRETRSRVEMSPAPVDRRQPNLNLALTPRWDTEDPDQPVDAVVQATASGLGPSAWRVASKPLDKTWSIWMRQDLARGFSVVASADSTSKKPKPASLGSASRPGTLLTTFNAMTI